MRYCPPIYRIPGVAVVEVVVVDRRLCCRPSSICATPLSKRLWSMRNADLGATEPCAENRACCVVRPVIANRNPVILMTVVEVTFVMKKKPLDIVPDAVNVVPPDPAPAPTIVSGLLTVRAEDQVQFPGGNTTVSPGEAAKVGRLRICQRTAAVSIVSYEHRCGVSMCDTCAHNTHPDGQ